jgi:hypothetical protein
MIPIEQIMGQGVPLFRPEGEIPGMREEKGFPLGSLNQLSSQGFLAALGMTEFFQAILFTYPFKKPGEISEVCVEQS